MGLLGSVGSFSSAIISIDEQSHKKPKSFEKYKLEIEKTKQYIKAKREAFYKNNNLKDR